MSRDSVSIDKIIVREIYDIFIPLESINSSNRMMDLLRDLGWVPPGTGLYDAFIPLLTEVGSLQKTVYQIDEAVSDDDYIILAATLAEKIVPLFDKISKLYEQTQTLSQDLKDFITNSEFATEFPKRLLDYLLISYLRSTKPRTYSILQFIGFIEIEDITATEPFHPSPSFTLQKIWWENFPLLFSDPLTLSECVYHWKSGFNSNLFLSNIETILRSFGISGGLYKQDSKIAANLGQPNPEDIIELRIPIYQDGRWPYTYREAGVSISPKDNGFAILPYLLGLAKITEDLSENWQFTINDSLNLNSGLGLLLRPPHDLQIDTDLFTKPETAIDGRIEVGIKRKADENRLHLIFGSQDGSHLGFEGGGISLLAATASNDQELAVELNIDGLTLLIDTSKGDGFLQEILSGIKFETVTDITLGISNKDGFYFTGSAALEITIPIHETLGPIKIESFYLAINVEDGIKVTLAATVGAEIGPISACVEQMGINIPITFPSDNSGNLGPLNIDGIQFKPPTGVGMLVDADVVTGGGFIEFDRINERYAGILQLSFGEIGLTAIGLITTRMPDGSPGFSMLISVSVEFSPEIQITMGFTLSAVGGLIGINRTMDLAALEKRFRNRALDSILFPKDPILNASKIISDLRAVFPPKEDRYVIGAMVAIGYGNPNIIRGEIGIFIEIPEPIRASIMGQLSAILPEEDNPIVVLNLDVLGIIRPSKKKITIDSVLYDSRILYLNLFGDAAIWLKWGKNPQFIMSLGGFHPKFTPPPGFPKLQRLTLALNWGNTLFMLFQFYMAITPNSLQFGTKFDITIKWGKDVIITGGMSFDALFYFSPFSFDVDITGYVVAKAFGKELSNIRLYFNLSGPTPWHAIGSAKFKILFVKFKVDFDIIKGSVRKIDPIPAIDPWDPLKTALERREAWSSSLPPTSNMVESLRPIDEPKDLKDKKSMPILVHPAGKLEVRQNVLPFEVTLDKFGNAPVKDHNTFSLESVSSGEIELKCTHVSEYFAKKPFKNLTFKEQLSSESYELQQAGIEITSEAIKVPGKMKAKSLEYENILINDDRTSKTQEKKGRLSWEAGKRQITMNAAGQSLIRRKGHRAFEIRDQEPGIQVNEEKYRIVFNSNMKSIPAIKHFIPNYHEDMKRSEAEAALGKYLRQHPENLGKVQMVHSYEVLV